MFKRNVKLIINPVEWYLFPYKEELFISTPETRFKDLRSGSANSNIRVKKYVFYRFLCFQLSFIKY